MDGIDDKLSTISNTNDKGVTYPLFKFTSTCVDDESSDLAGELRRCESLRLSGYRPILMDGFVHTAEGYAKSCNANGGCAGNFTDTNGRALDGLLRPGIPQLLLLHGIAVRALRSLVLAGVEQEHRQPHCDLHRRNDPGPDERSGQRRSPTAARYPDDFPGARSGQCLLEDLLHRHPGLLPGRG